MGPRIEPCGTPQVMSPVVPHRSPVDNDDLPIVTEKVLLDE